MLKDILSQPEIAQAFDLENLPPRVFLDNLNADSINIKVFYWFKSLDYWAYMAHCREGEPADPHSPG